MPKQTFKIESFHGGLNSNSDPRDIRENESSSLKDVAIDSVGKIKTLGSANSGVNDSNTSSILKNTGLFVMSSDRKIDGTLSNETLIFLHDNTSHTIDIKDSDGWSEEEISFSGGVSTVYYNADGVLRISDSNLIRDPEWFGYIIDERFDGLNADSGGIGWRNVNQSLSTPTSGKCLISIPFKGSDSNGVNSSSKEYIGEVIDGTIAQSSTSTATPQVVDHSSVNLRVGIEYNQLLENTASALDSDNATDVDRVYSPYPFIENNVHVIGSTSDNDHSDLSDTVTSGNEFTIDGSSSMAVAFFISSGRQYNDLKNVIVFFGVTNNTNCYKWVINSDEIIPDCWNFIVCAEGTHDGLGTGSVPDFGTDFDFWEVKVNRVTTGFISNDAPSWKLSGPLQISATSINTFNPGVYDFHYTWLYDTENKQESLPYKFGDIDTYYSGEHDASDNSTRMTDSGASFVTDQLIGRLIKNTTDGSEGFITDNTGTTATVGSLKFGSDNSWDDSGDDDYEIPASNVNKLVILRNPCLLNFDAYICSNNSSPSYALNRRISGSRLYYKKEENDNYFLIGELDFVDKGFKFLPEADTLSYTMIDTTDITAPILSTTALIKAISPETANTIDTFKTINGFSTEVKSLDAKYKTAVVHGRRVYIGNIKRPDGKTYPDRIVKSQVNRFDTFPEGMGAVDVVIRDGENIVKLEAFADRILQFKEHSLYIINVSESVDFLEDTFRNKGCAFDYHVVRTDLGIAWFNDHGCYLYDGKSVIHLLEKNNLRLISEEDWSLFVKDGTDDPDMSSAMIGYVPKKKHLIIKNENNDIYLYDFVLQAWTIGIGKISESTAMTNFALDGDQDLFYIDNTTTVRKTWQTSSQSSTGFEYITQDIDFGQPGVGKKVYKVIITYKSGATTNVQVDYDVNGGTTFPYDFANGNNFTSNELASASGWQVAELIPDNASESNNIKSFQLRFATDGTVPSGFEINDITIIYRLKNIK